MRTYQLQPGTLLQWEHAWRRGLEARRKFVVSHSAFYALDLHSNYSNLWELSFPK
jgi:hypothetical protein